ncbi:MAG: ABC transporter ATP-binding protein [Peptococcaceae bacterium]|nr:ABC transporter ATP-binding protein [Peptococcaceae bacterium]
MKSKPLLKVDNLQVRIAVPGGVVRVLNGVSFQIRAGKVLGLLGESGCGKTVTCLSLAGLFNGPGITVSGNVELNGRSMMDLPAEKMRSVRGRELAMIMQNPMSAFNPLVTVGRHFTETIRSHSPATGREAWQTAMEYLRRAGLPDSGRVMEQYPFQLSGGMLQRVMVAIAMSMRPSVLLADEPTTSLDATLRAQILGQIAHLLRDFKTGALIVSHDLGVIARLADKVAVMYCGYIVEMASVAELFDRPLHPYTRALLSSRAGIKKKRLTPVGGQPPSLLNLGDSCPFFERCAEVERACLNYRMEPEILPGGRMVRCAGYGASKGKVLRGLA